MDLLGGRGSWGVEPRGKGRSSTVAGPPNLGSEAAFPQLNGGSRSTFVSQNLDVQRAEKLTYHPIPKDKLLFTDEDVAEAKKEWDNTLLGVVLGASPSLKFVRDYVDVCWKGHVLIVQVL